MKRTFRRICTGVDDSGKSCVLQDQRIAESAVTSGFELWHERPTAGAVGAQNPLQGFYPLAGESIFRVVQLPVADAAVSPADLARMADGFFSGNHIPECRTDTSRHPFMHRTPTVDYSMVLSGQLSLLLDRGEPIALQPLDTVVQRMTNHFWVNTGDEPAFLLVAMIGPGLVANHED